jgi:hypothetical protein
LRNKSFSSNKKKNKIIAGGKMKKLLVVLGVVVLLIISGCDSKEDSLISPQTENLGSVLQSNWDCITSTK